VKRFESLRRTVERAIKRLYDNTCQICRTRLVTASGPYSEGAHIRPLGIPHNGPDTLENILCLCPNCHALFDGHALTELPRVSQRSRITLTPSPRRRVAKASTQ
jgi:predicted restriction endonuclease